MIDRQGSIIIVVTKISVGVTQCSLYIGASSATSGSVAASQKTVPVGMFPLSLMLSPCYIYIHMHFCILFAPSTYV